MKGCFSFLLVGFLLTASSLAAPLAELTSDKSTYSVSEAAQLRVHLATKPGNKDLEFFVSLKDQNDASVPLSVESATGDWIGTSLPFEEIGIL